MPTPSEQDRMAEELISRNRPGCPACRGLGMTERQRDQVSRPAQFEPDPEMENLERHLRQAPYLSLGDSVRRRLGYYAHQKQAAEQPPKERR